jgi:uncharacterized Zn-binding protein involved in type VI secretion
MPAAARANGNDSVFSRTGTGKNCGSAMTTSTGVGSGNVFINGIPGIRAGDAVALHPAGGCGPDTSGLSGGSSKVFINGRGAARIGDQYGSDNIITSGSSTVFFA